MSFALQGPSVPVVPSQDGESAIIAPQRLEIEAGCNILKQSVMISIRDQEDSHYRKQREGQDNGFAALWSFLQRITPASLSRRIS
jgi:hypothetical protein